MDEPTRRALESAAAAGSREQYETLGNELEEARSEFAELEQVANEKFGPGALSFASANQVFDDCRTTEFRRNGCAT